ncbi:hypothetical protein ACQ4PT_012297 [Festuca glaucescens]
MSPPWTKRQNKLFEKVLARYDENTPDRWQKVARDVGDGRSAEEVKRHYEELEQDVKHIEEGDLRQYGGSGTGSGNTNGGSSGGGRSQEQRINTKDMHLPTR